MDPARSAVLQEAMERLADGDRAAFHTVFVITWPLVKAFCRSALPQADAEDAAQQALLKVFERASVFEPGRGALPWIFGVTANECRTARRRGSRRREEPLERASGARQGGASPEDEVILQDLEKAARHVLSELGPGDLATILDSLRPPAKGPTFRKRLERARKRLRAAWSARYGIT
jgi:RNA polymerase sigma-70 factor (ECF subfamily)